MKITLITLMIILIASTSIASEVNNISDLFTKGSVNSNIRYYYIETNKENPSSNLSTSAYANSIGARLNYATARYKGISTDITFMSTHPFSLANKVDTSVIGRDDGIRLAGNASGDIAQDAFSVLGELFINYEYENFNFWYGRKVIKTPLVHAKDVRMIPSAVQGADIMYDFRNGLNIGLGYISDFKQRTSSKFINIVEHALGSNTKVITGKNATYLVPLYITYKDKSNRINLYDYYAHDFMNSLYFDFESRGKLNENIIYMLAIQGIYQHSVGHSRNAMNNYVSAFGGEIDAGALGIKAGLAYKQSKVFIAYSKVLNASDGEHNSLVMPWDGTPLFTNTITSNNLFGSNYSKGLTSNAGSIAGTQGMKFSYVQKYKDIGVKGFKSVVSYARFKNTHFRAPLKTTSEVA